MIESEPERTCAPAANDNPSREIQRKIPSRQINGEKAVRLFQMDFVVWQLCKTEEISHIIRGKMLKKALIPILGIFVILVTGIALFALMKEKEPVEKQIRTDIEPIYNHFPGLPATDDIQWCSRTSDGIGLTTVWIYAFAFYDHNVGAELGGEGSLNEKTDFYFLPEDLVDSNSKWRKWEDMGDVFQEGIKLSEKMGVSIYINEAGNIIYMEAVGD